MDTWVSLADFERFYMKGSLPSANAYHPSARCYPNSPFIDFDHQSSLKKIDLRTNDLSRAKAANASEDISWDERDGPLACLAAIALGASMRFKRTKCSPHPACTPPTSRTSQPAQHKLSTETHAHTSNERDDPRARLVSKDEAVAAIALQLKEEPTNSRKRRLSHRSSDHSINSKMSESEKSNSWNDNHSRARKSRARYSDSEDSAASLEVPQLHKGTSAGSEGSPVQYQCNYCKRVKKSSSAGTDGRVRIRCECGGKHRDSKPRMHAM